MYKKLLLTTFSFFGILSMNAQFGPPQLISTQPNTNNFKQFIRTADIDSDGKLDIIVGSSANEICRIFRNEGNFTFAAPFIIPGSWQRLAQMETADLNNDGKPDIITIDVELGNLFWHPNIDGTFPQQILINSDLISVTTRINCADFNSDGAIDLVILNHFNAQLYLNDGSGNFGEPQNIIPAEDETEFYDNVIGDFNNDGIMDLAITSDGFKIYLNDGEGNFTETPGGGIAISFLLESADYNNDGYDDILMDANTLVPYMNSPTGFSVVSAFSPNNENYQTIFSSDLDNDGDLDVISEDNQTNAFFWYENVGGGTSWIRHTISISFNFSSIFGVRAADLDGDGDNDLIRSSSNGDVAIYENQLILKVKDFDQNSFILFPNPASDMLHIVNSNQQYTIEIYDLLGKIILRENVNSKDYSVNVSAIAAGNYLVKIVDAGGSSVKKLVLK